VIIDEIVGINNPEARRFFLAFYGLSGILGGLCYKTILPIDKMKSGVHERAKY
jgi:hypothetical protein